MDDNNSIQKYRAKIKKEKTKRRVIITLVILILISIILLVFQIFKTMTERNAVPIYDKAELSTGFPITMPTSASYSMKTMGNNIVLLTDTTLYVYNTSGERIFAYSHIYNSPVIDSNETRTLVYDSNGASFAVCTKKKELFSKTLEDDIIFGAIADNGNIAIVTDSDRYASVMKIYDKTGDEIYSWSSTEKIIALDFAPNSKSCTASISSSDNGQIYSKVYCFKFDNAKSEEWSARIDGTLVMELKAHSDGNATAVGDNKLCIVGKNGIKSQYDYNLSVAGYSATDDIVSLLLNDSENRQNTLLIFNETGKVLGQTQVTDDTDAIIASNTDVYLLEEKNILMYNSTAQQIKTANLNSEFKDIDIVGKYFYMLSDTIIDRINTENMVKKEASEKQTTASNISQTGGQ